MGTSIEIDEVLADMSDKCAALIAKVEEVGQALDSPDEMLAIKQILRSHEYFLYLHYDIESPHPSPSSIEDTYGVHPGSTFTYLRSRAASEGVDTLQAINEYLERADEMLSPDWFDLSGLDAGSSGLAAELISQAHSDFAKYKVYARALPKDNSPRAPAIKAKENQNKVIGSPGL